MSSFDFNKFRGRRVGLFGLGKSNASILSALPDGTEVILRSENTLPHLPQTEARILAAYTGERAFENPTEDLLILSPSVRRERTEFIPFLRSGTEFTSDCELFFKAVSAPVFAVSGSDGKSTVTILTSLLLSERFGYSPAIGNLGVPMLTSVSPRARAYVTELSSFMLSYGRYRTFRGAITNITENHLDWHKSYNEYIRAKLSLFSRSEEPVLNADDPLCAAYFDGMTPWGVASVTQGYAELKKKFRAQAIYTKEDGFIKRCGEPVIPISEINRREEHNLKNLTLALALTDGYVSRDHMKKVAREFTGLPHRCEVFLERDGMTFVDSSVDSTPSRTATTLNSFGRRVIVILGGKGKNLSYEPLCAPLRKWASLAVIVGENREEILNTVEGSCPCRTAQDAEEGAALALSLMQKGDVLILSPASTSFDKYRDYADRGRKFKEVIFNYFDNKTSK